MGRLGRVEGMVACVTQQRNNDEHPSPTTTHLLLDTSSPLFLLPRYIPRIPGGQVFINWNRQTKETTFSPTFKEERNMGGEVLSPDAPPILWCVLCDRFFFHGALEIYYCVTVLPRGRPTCACTVGSPCTQWWQRSSGGGGS